MQVVKINRENCKLKTEIPSQTEKMKFEYIQFTMYVRFDATMNVKNWTKIFAYYEYESNFNCDLFERVWCDALLWS